MDDRSVVISYEEYCAYGSTSYQAVHPDTKSAAKRYRFTGKERDQETGLAYHDARYYAPWLGRWATIDPAGFIDGTNLYAYTNCNPISRVDPEGTDSRDPQTGGSQVFGIPDLTSGSFSSGGYEDSGQTGQSNRASTEVGPGVISNPQDRTFWSRGGGTLATGLITTGVGAAILLSGPLGWVGGLTAAMSIGGGVAGSGVGVTQLAASYSGATTSQKDQQINNTAGTAMMLSSPGGLLGGTFGAAAAGTADGLREGAFWGGITEAGMTLATAASRMLLREIAFGIPRDPGWNRVRSEIQISYGLGDAATRTRTNSAFHRGIERVDLSHWKSQRSFRGSAGEWFFNRPWNTTPMWASEHALIDPSRMRFMSASYRASAEPLAGAARQFRLMPPWLMQSGTSGARMGATGLQFGLGD